MVRNFTKREHMFDAPEQELTSSIQYTDKIDKCHEWCKGYYSRWYNGIDRLECYRLCNKEAHPLQIKCSIQCPFGNIGQCYDRCLKEDEENLANRFQSDSEMGNQSLMFI